MSAQPSLEPEEEITPEMMNWINHSLSLAEARCRKFLYSDDPERLLHERQVIRYVVSNISSELHGIAGVWKRWMVEHAKLQILRYANQVTEADFRAESGALLDWRDREERRR